jgi:hypothetical protein
MVAVYSTSTPVIARAKYHFNYPCKREAYVNCCSACYALNQVAKTAPDNLRFMLYRLKIRWVKHLYHCGFCVQAYEDCSIWHFKFKVDGLIYAWHLPDKVVTWQVKEQRAAILYEPRDAMPNWHRSLSEAVALLEWCLA